MSSGVGAAPRMESVNSELLTLTYGALVSQIIRDYEDPREVNAQLEAMGYNIGLRLVDEFCAKSRSGARCKSFRETMDTVAKEAFRMFLGVAAVVGDFSADSSACTLRIPDNPLAGAAQARGPFPNQPPSFPPQPHPPPHPQAMFFRASPAADFVELPASYSALRYSNILCGVIRGALEMVSLKVSCTFVKDALAGDDGTEIRVALQEVLQEGSGLSDAYKDE
jgi:hypothetical protein